MISWELKGETFQVSSLRNHFSPSRRIHACKATCANSANESSSMFFCTKFLLGHQMKAVNALFFQGVLTIFATGCSNTFFLLAGSLNYISIGS